MAAVSKHEARDYYPWAICLTKDCPWLQRMSRSARDAAKRHVKVLGHHVEIVVERHEQWAPDGYDFEGGDKSVEEIKALDLDAAKWG